MPARDLGSPVAGLGAGPDATLGAGEILRRANDRRSSAHQRWPRSGADPPHPARARIGTSPAQLEAGVAATAASKNKSLRPSEQPEHLSLCSADL